jgi:hypothetical protein
VSELNDLIKMLDEVNGNAKPMEEKPKENNQPAVAEKINFPVIPIVYEPFSISKFTQEIAVKSSLKNKSYREHVENINAYDIASGCIKEIVFKLTNTPIESFTDKWLPVLMRSTIGNAIHNFIQDNSDQFTEREVSMKIPSIRTSVRLDNLIGDNILVEIKSCTYSDYQKIINSRKPRIADFYQAITYKYLLENHLEEAKNPGIEIREGTVKPKLDKYNINKIQFIYVAHDLIASDTEGGLNEALNHVKTLKRSLNSKYNTFFFITTLLIDITDELADPYINYIKTKIQAINYYVDNNLSPDKDDPFIESSKCFFCLYKKNCNITH